VRSFHYEGRVEVQDVEPGMAGDVLLLLDLDKHDAYPRDLVEALSHAFDFPILGEVEGTYSIRVERLS
jgi:hypothetical protein